MGTADNSKPNCLKILCTKDRPECRDCPSCKKFQRREIESQPPTEVKTEQASRTHKLASARGMETVTVPRSEERRKNVPKEDPCIKCEQKRALSARTLPYVFQSFRIRISLLTRSIRTDLTVRLNATYSVPIMRMNALTAMFAYQSRDSKPAGESKCKDEESCPGSDCAFRGIC
jgi:adenine-specific DNA glycosylase